MLFNSCMLGNFPCFFKKKSFRNTIRMPNSLDLDQDSLCPDLGPNCLQRLTADVEHSGSVVRALTVDRRVVSLSHTAGRVTMLCS